jgi:Fe-Mn family superoxide dismutase
MNVSFAAKGVNSLATSLFNNAAQIWNHDFFWNCFSEKATSNSLNNESAVSVINEGLMDLINGSFGSFEQFKSEFSNAAASHFGSGWCWLLKHSSNDGNVFGSAASAGKTENTLVIQCTANAENPLMHGFSPLFVCDLWEHAYYVDYRNNRLQYIQNMWNFINWNFVNNNIDVDHAKSLV